MVESKLLWCEIAQRFMGSLFIVFLRPCVHDSANLAQSTENMEFDISSSRKVRLNRSTYEFCAGLPGWMNSSSTPRCSAHPAGCAETNSGPLSMHIFVGYPLHAAMRSGTRMTRAAGKLASTSAAGASRLKSSSALNARKRWPRGSASLMKFTDQRALTAGCASGRTGGHRFSLRRMFNRGCR